MESGQNAKAIVEDGINLFTIIRGIAVSYIITIPMFIIFSYALTYTSFPEKYIKPTVVVTTVISILIAGMSVTKRARSKGWFSGSMVGLIYMLVLYTVSSIVLKDFSINRYVVTMTIIGVLTGAIGGIVGINFADGVRRKIRNRKYVRNPKHK